MNSSGGVSATLIESSSNILFYLFSILKYKTEQNKSIMGSCYSGNHNAEDHIHMDIITCNIEEPQLEYRLGTVNNKLLGGLD